MDLLLDFINIKRIDLDSIKDLFQRKQFRGSSPLINGHSFFFEVLDGEGGGERYSLFSEEVLRLYSIEDDRYLKKYLIYPGDSNYQRAFDILGSFQEELRAFVDKCINGRPDMGYLRDIIKDHEVFSLDLLPSENVWKPRVKINTQQSLIFQFHIRSIEILSEFLNGNGAVFSKIKKCKNCGSYYLPKSAKSIFCNNACKNEYHYRTAH